jgi:YesN/AraC family two-component response regulator
LNVLIVDDDIPTTEVLRIKLNWESFGAKSIRCAYNIHDAWDMLQTDDPKLILCDIEMPKGSGLDLIRRARENGKSARFIFITCHADFTYATQALDFEASAYITKPLDLPRINETVARVVKSIRSSQPPTQAFNDPAADKISSYIEAHYAENITRDGLAAHLFISPNHLSKVFKEKIGQGLTDYVNGVRLRKAKELLAGSALNVSEVAARVGFDNFSYFSTLFRKSTGISPSDYRHNR